MFESWIMKNKWCKEYCWLLPAMHYPHSFKLLQTAYSMDPWSGTYRFHWREAAGEDEERKAEAAFNKLVGGKEIAV